MKFFIKRFTLKYQQLREGVKLVQMWHTKSRKACMCNFYVQINDTSKMNKVAKNFIILGGLQK